jgi:hypothetical protein
VFLYAASLWGNLTIPSIPIYLNARSTSASIVLRTRM